MPGYVATLKTFQSPQRALADLVPWASVVDAETGILSTRDDGLLRQYTLDPLDMGALPESERGAVMVRLNQAFKQLRDGSAVWIRLRHIPAPPDTTVSLTDCPEAALLDTEYRTSMNTPGRLWENAVVLSLWHRPPPPVRSFIHQCFFRDPPTQELTDTLADFRHETDEVAALIAQGCVAVTPMAAAETLTSLKRLISVYDHPVTVPDIDCDIGYLLADSTLVTGSRPALVTPDRVEYLRPLSLSYELPPQTTVGMWRELLRFPFPFELVHRVIPMPREEARKLTSKQQMNILAAQKDWRAVIWEFINRTSAPILDSHSGKAAADADDARHRVLSDEDVLVRLSTVFVFRGEDREAVDQQLRTVQTFLHGFGCPSIAEDLNAVEAWFSTLPGQIHANVRRLHVSAMNALHLSPFHRPSRGVTWNAHLKAPALCQTMADGGTPYGLDPYVGDVGHTLGPMGPFGSGKSTKSAFLDFICWLARYARGQAFGFDHGGSFRCPTLFVRGRYIDLGAGDLGMQILRDVDDDQELPWIRGWLLDRVEEKHIPITSTVERCIDGVLRAMRVEYPQAPRRLFAWLSLLKDQIRALELMALGQSGNRRWDLVVLKNSIHDALKPFAWGETFGHLTDAPQESWTDHRVVTFELERFMKMPAAYPGVLSLVVHRLEARCQGQPTRFSFGEAWQLFAHPSWLKHLKQWMPSWRRNNISATFSSQSVTQLRPPEIKQMSELTDLIKGGCQTQILLPNARAVDAEVRQLYLDLGLYLEEIQRLAVATPKQDAYVIRPDHRRMMQLRLSPMAAAVCGANSKEAHRDMDRLLDSYGVDAFPGQWLRHCGFEEQAHVLEETIRSADPEHAARVLAGVAAAC